MIECGYSNNNFTKNGIEDTVSSSDCESYVEDLNNIKYPLWYKKQLRLPNISKWIPSVIEVTIKRNANGDFGITLKKVIQIERHCSHDGSVLGSKYQMNQIEPLKMNNDFNLLPGDRLLTINNIEASTSSREKIIQVIKSCEKEINVSVVPSPECLELSFRRFSNISNRFINIRHWILEKKSFSGLYKVLYNSMLHNFEFVKYEDLIEINNDSVNENETIWVDFDEGFAGGKIIKDLDNGKTLIRLVDSNCEIEVPDEDIKKANNHSYFLEENLINLPHLNDCSIIHAIKQRFCSNLIHTYIGSNLLFINPMENLNCYSEKIASLFYNADIEDLPPHVYSIAQASLKSLRNSNANPNILIMGRSGSGKSHVLQNLINYFILAANNTSINITKIKELWFLLDSFTNTRTGINTNASRCGKLITLQYRKSSQQLQLNGLSVQLFLFDKYRVVRRPTKEPTFHIFYNFIAGLSDQDKFKYNLVYSNESNNFMRPLQRQSEKQTASEMWRSLHECTKALSITDDEWDVICRLLATIYHLGMIKLPQHSDDNDSTTRKYSIVTNEAFRFAAKTIQCNEETLYKTIFEYHTDDQSKIGLVYTSRDFINGFVAGLYSNIIDMIVYFINRSLCPSKNQYSQTITITDPPGLQVPTVYDKNNVENYQDLIYNYAYERLLYIDSVRCIQTPINQYESKTVDYFENIKINDNLIQILDKSGKSNETKGILNLLDNEALVGTKDSLKKKLLKLVESHEAECHQKKLKSLFSLNDKLLKIYHCNGTHSISYDIDDWLKMCVEIPTVKSSEHTLKMCNNNTIKQLLTSMSQNSHKNFQDIWSHKSIVDQCRKEMDAVINHIITNTNGANFSVYCVSPTPNAGLSQLKENVNESIFIENVVNGSLFSIPLVKNQLESFNIMSQLKILKLGYPEEMTFKDFVSLTDSLLMKSKIKHSNEINQSLVIDILNDLKIKPSSYKIGQNKIYFSIGTIYNLKNLKEIQSKDFVEKLQAVCRRYLSIKNFEKFKLQNDAIRIIQRNSQSYLNLRNFKWWKLYQNVKPLIISNHISTDSNVAEMKYQELNRKYQELKKLNMLKEDEVDCLRKEKINLKSNIDELNSSLEDAKISEALLNKKIEELKEKMCVDQIDGTNLKIKETLDLRNVSDDCFENSENLIEKEYSNQKYSQHDLEFNKQYNKLKEINVSLKDELAECHHIINNSKSDNEIEEIVGKYKEQLRSLNTELEKIQTQNYELNRDKLEAIKQRDEKDYLMKEMEKLQNVSKPDMPYFNDDVLESDIIDLRSKKHQLEQRTRDLEEEVETLQDNLDISQREIDKWKFQFSKAQRDKESELAEKDDEIEATRNSCNRKLQNLEQQIEQEHSKYYQLMKQKRDIDIQLSELKEEIEEMRESAESEKKLKKELKSALDKLHEVNEENKLLKNMNTDKSEIKNLKIKFDEIELAREISEKNKMKAERDLEDCLLELETLKKSNLENEEKIKQIRKQNDSLANTNDDLEFRLEELERKGRLSQTQSQDLNTTIVNLNERIDILEKEKLNYIRETRDLNETLLNTQNNSTDRDELIRLKNKINEINMKLLSEESARQRLANINDKLKEQVQTVQRENENIQSLVDIEHEKNRKSQKQINELKNINDEHFRNNQSYKKQINQMEDRINDLEEDVMKKHHSLSSANIKIKSLEGILKEENDSTDENYSEVLDKVDSLIKNRKFSMDNSRFAPKLDGSLKRNSVCGHSLTNSLYFESDNE